MGRLRQVAATSLTRRGTAFAAAVSVLVTACVPSRATTSPFEVLLHALPRAPEEAPAYRLRYVDRAALRASTEQQGVGPDFDQAATDGQVEAMIGRFAKDSPGRIVELRGRQVLVRAAADGDVAADWPRAKRRMSSIAKPGANAWQAATKDQRPTAMRRLRRTPTRSSQRPASGAPMRYATEKAPHQTVWLALYDQGVPQDEPVRVTRRLRGLLGAEGNQAVVRRGQALLVQFRGSLPGSLPAPSGAFCGN